MAMSSIRYFRSHLLAKRFGVFCKQIEASFSTLEESETTHVSKDERFKCSHQNTLQNLQQILRVKPVVATDMLMKEKSLAKKNFFDLKANIRVCVANRINKTTIINHPYILGVEDLYEKIEELRHLEYDINDTVLLADIPFSKLRKFVEKELENRGNGRLKQLSELLQIPMKEICENIHEKKFLLGISIDNLKRKVALLQTFGIGPEDIVNDLWVLRYTDEKIKDRLEFARSNKVEQLKPWMVRSKSSILDRYFKRRSDNKQVLGEHSLTEYLSERLECPEDQVNVLIYKLPAIKNKSLIKLKEIIDFLFDKGFKPYHICRVPKILLHSVETTRKRIKELENEGMKIDSLSILTKSKKQYMQFYEALVKSNKKLKGINK